MSNTPSAFELLARHVPAKFIAWSAVLAMVAFAALVATTILAVAVGFEFKLFGQVLGRNPHWQPGLTTEVRVLELIKENTPAPGMTEPQVHDLIVAALSELPGAETLPNGAVVAFDLSSGCPPEAGWRDVGSEERERFAGRMMVAVGPKVNRAEGGTTEARQYSAHGGEEKVTLRIEEMPSHGHPMYQDDHIGSQGSRRIRAAVPYSPATAANNKTPEVGGNQPHNNMPPFITLYFCKKVAG